MSEIAIFLFGFLVLNALFILYAFYKRTKGENVFASKEDVLAIPSVQNVDTVSKKELPFDPPVPSETISGVLYDHDSGTYCLFALVFPELHLILKTPTDFSQEELERLAILFTRCFKQKLQVRVFINNNSGVVETVH